MKLISLICSLLFIFNVQAQGFLPIANIIKIKGVVLIDKEKAPVGAEIARGMEIKIPKKSDYIIVKYQNGHLVKMVGATVKAEEMTEKSSLLHVQRGQIYTWIKALLPEEKFVLKTTEASLAAQAAKFVVLVDEAKKKTFLGVAEGNVVVQKETMSVKPATKQMLKQLKLAMGELGKL